jgi:hypothetical protein
MKDGCFLLETSWGLLTVDPYVAKPLAVCMVTMTLVALRQSHLNHEVKVSRAVWEDALNRALE